MPNAAIESNQPGANVWRDALPGLVAGAVPVALFSLWYYSVGRAPIDPDDGYRLHTFHQPGAAVAIVPVLLWVGGLLGVLLRHRGLSRPGGFLCGTAVAAVQFAFVIFDAAEGRSWDAGGGGGLIGVLFLPLAPVVFVVGLGLIMGESARRRRLAARAATAEAARRAGWPISPGASA
jgi:hypothetical protein